MEKLFKRLIFFCLTVSMIALDVHCQCSREESTIDRAWITIVPEVGFKLPSNVSLFFQTEACWRVWFAFVIIVEMGLFDFLRLEILKLSNSRIIIIIIISGWSICEIKLIIYLFVQMILTLSISPYILTLGRLELIK